jgi:bifunctional ADP-heptose synthase (sugar kinase/adenylyltransferase)
MSFAVDKDTKEFIENTAKMDEKGKAYIEVKGEKKFINELSKEQIKTMMVTLSEHGVYIGNEKSKTIIPAHVRNISDVSGAGDTVISVAALCLGLGLSETMIASLANLAGGLVCEQVGVVPINKDLLKKEAEQLLA